MSNWEKYKHQYTSLNKEELIQKMRKAHKQVIFTPPLKEYDYVVRWHFDGYRQQWRRIGFWIFIDLTIPLISFCILWWIFVFGRFIDWDSKESTATTSEN